jgi:hypothetical protein
MGTCSVEYYRRAVELITSRTESPFFWVFSDDLKWCEENLSFINPKRLVFHQAVEGRMEWYLELMKRCRHFIIPNSTFAWWAAFLSSSAENVVASLQWFQDEHSDDVARRIVPLSWLRLPNR